MLAIANILVLPAAWIAVGCLTLSSTNACASYLSNSITDYTFTTSVFDLVLVREHLASAAPRVAACY